MAIPACKCGSISFFLAQKSPSQIGAYCADCGKWIKWVGSADVKILKNKGYKVHNDGYKPPNLVEKEASANYGSVPNIPKVVSNVVEEEDSVFVDGVREPVFREAEPVSKPPELTLSSMNAMFSEKETPEMLTCQLCTRGVVPVISRVNSVEVSAFQNTIYIKNIVDNKDLCVIRAKFCLNCGKRL